MRDENEDSSRLLGDGMAGSLAAGMRANREHQERPDFGPEPPRCSKCRGSGDKDGIFGRDPIDANECPACFGNGTEKSERLVTEIGELRGGVEALREAEVHCDCGQRHKIRYEEPVRILLNATPSPKRPAEVVSGNLLPSRLTALQVYCMHWDEYDDAGDGYRWTNRIPCSAALELADESLGCIVLLRDSHGVPCRRKFGRYERLAIKITALGRKVAALNAPIDATPETVKG